MVDQSLRCDTDLKRGGVAEHVNELRRSLPSQRIARGLDEARIRYRIGFYRQVEKEIGRTLPRKPFSRRYVSAWTIENSPRLLPDAGLLGWEEARQSGVFETFWILEPSMENNREHSLVIRG